MAYLQSQQAAKELGEENVSYLKQVHQIFSGITVDKKLKYKMKHAIQTQALSIITPDEKWASF